MEKTAVIFVGIQASGKSMFYREKFGELVHVNLDTLKTRYQEKILFETCLHEGKSFVVDNTNPTRADRERYLPAARAFGFRTVGYYFQSSIDACVERNPMLEGKSVAYKNELLFQKGINYNELPSWQKRGIGVSFGEVEKMGFNPVRGESVVTKRRELVADYELPVGEDYREYVLKFLQS